MVRPRGTVALVGHARQGDRRPGAAVAPGGRAWRAPTRTATERGPGATRRRTVDVLPGPRGRRRPSRPGAWSRPPTRWAASRRPWPTPAPPGAGAPSRSHSTSRKGHDPMSRRPGFVLEVDKSTPPTLFWNGEGFSLETPARGQPGDLRPRAHEGARGPLPRHPPRPAQPAGRPRPAAGAAPPGHEAHHLLRRHLAAAPAHGGSRHPPDGDRDRARHGGGGRGRRRRCSSPRWPCTGA